MFGKRFAGVLLSVFMCANVWADEFAVSDSAFQACLDERREERAWSTAEDVLDIECHDRDIRSLDGIEQFTRLEKLSLYNNAITRAQLSDMPQLRHVNLARNQLEEITLANLPRLEELYLFRNNLRTLVLQNLPALKSLRGNSNRMLTFEYANLPALEKIYLFDNELETIDIHNLPSMEYMDVRENPMPDKLYEDMDVMTHTTILHDGNADDW